MTTEQTAQSPTDPAPAGTTDHLEGQAAIVAGREGHDVASNQDRERALDELNRTAPPAYSSPPTPDEEHATLVAGDEARAVAAKEHADQEAPKNPPPAEHSNSSRSTDLNCG